MSLREIYRRYRDRVEFIMIYLREAHPRDGWWIGGGLPGLILKLRGSKVATNVDDPTTIEERRAVAGRCQRKLKYEIPTFVDTMDDAVNKAYAAKPTRLYLIGLDGTVAYAGGLGPFGLKPDELDNAIKAYLASMKNENVG